jgi:polar amino acid transport system substrate-binding protein
MTDKVQWQQLRRAAISMLAGIAALTGTGGLHASAEETTRIAVEGGFPPFNYLDSAGELKGFDIEIANALCEAAALRCELATHKWTEMIPDLIDNKIDAVISSMSITAERREKVAFTKAYYNSPSSYVVRKGAGVTSVDAATLKDLKLGVTLETSQADYIKSQYGQSFSAQLFANSPELYKGLAEGKVDIILEDKLAVYDWLTNTKEGACCTFVGVDVTDPAYFGEGAGIAVRKEDEELRNKFNKALDTIVEDGTFDMINAKYFPFSIR